jgi:hypothetical protein
MLYNIAFKAASADRASTRSTFADKHPSTWATVRRAFDTHDSRQCATLTSHVRFVKRFD